jgi:hypothetical protein
MTSNIAQLSLQVAAAPDTPPDDLAALADQLRQELAELDVESVEPARVGPTPAGSKAIEAFALDILIVKVAPALLGKVARTVQDWLQRSHAQAIELTIDGDTIRFDRASQQDRNRLIGLLEAKYAKV